MFNREKCIEEIIEVFHSFRLKMAAEGDFGDECDIPHSQWLVLSIVERRKSATIKDISNALGVSSSAATQLVNGLAQKGDVIRAESVQDRRETSIRLSLKAKRLFVAMKKKLIAQMSKIFQALSDDEMEMFFKLNTKIISGTENRGK